VTWTAVVFWDTQDPTDVGWRWRIQDLEGGTCLSGASASAEDGIRRVKALLREKGIDPESVWMDILDDGVWDKC